jgi:RNA polymerase sigma factor for flagellar operon FliA
MAKLEPEVLTEAWILYKETGHIDHRNRLVLHYTSLVGYVAKKVGGGLPSTVDREDLISYGMFGLIDAIKKFDLDKGVKFETYAVTRIRGAIIDELRDLDWVPRSIRSKAREIDSAREELERELGRPAEHNELAQHLGLSLEDYWHLASQANATVVESRDQHADGESVYETTFDPLSNPEDLFQASEITELLGEAISTMDERSKTILVLYYLEDMTLAEIGQILGVTQSRVCQLQSKVLQALSGVLGQGGLAAA